MTIIGIEKRLGGSRSLLVFDPAYKPSKAMSKTLDCNSITASGADVPSMSLIKPYRRGKKYLKRYHAFETLRLVASPRPSLSDKE